MIPYKLLQRLFIASAFLITALAGAATPTPSMERGVEIRALMSDLIQSSALAQNEQAQAMRSVLAKHPKILQWVAEGEDFEELLKDANLGGVRAPVANDKEIAKKIQILAQSQVDEFLKEAGFKEEIRKSLKARLAKLSPGDIPDELQKDPELRNFAQDQAKSAARYFGHLSEKERIEALQILPDNAFVKMAEEVNQSIQTTKLTESDAIRELTSKNAFNINEDLLSAQEMSDYLRKYFEKLPLENRRDMFIAFLSLPPDASTEKQLAAVLNETGPAMQKLLQLIGESAKSEGLEVVLDQLKENVKQVPWEQMKTQIEKSLGGSIESKFKEFKTKPIGAGTVGQTYAATLLDGRKVIVKVRRPGIVEELKKEMDHLRAVAKGTPPEKLVDQVEENLIRETDYRIEGINTDTAKVALSDPKRGLHVAGRIEDMPMTEDLLIMERADGKSMASLQKLAKKGSKSAYTQERLTWMRDITETIYQKWFDNAIFGSGHYAAPEGFFHGDLHSGNYFVKRVRGSNHSALSKFLFNTDSPNFKITLIDLGNAGTLTLEQRRAFMHLGLAAAAGSQKEVVEALSRVAPLSDDQKANILKALTIEQWSELSPSERITLALKHGAFKADVKFPRDFLGFKRGQQFLEVAEKEVNGLLDHFDPEKKIRRADLKSVMVKVASRRLSIEVPGQLVNTQIREHTVMPVGDTARLSFRLLRDRIDGYFRPACVANGLKRNL